MACALSAASLRCLAFSSRSSFTGSTGVAARTYSKSTMTMKLQTAIVGLPNVGKSTLFNALTESQGAEMGNYPFCTIESNVGIVTVPDQKLEALGKLSESAKVIPATLEFVDVAGLIKGASQGEGLGNQFLSSIRQADAIVHGTSSCCSCRSKAEGEYWPTLRVFSQTSDIAIILISTSSPK